MRNKLKTTPVIDLPDLVEKASDSLDLGSVRLTHCLRSIGRLNDLVLEKSFFSNEQDYLRDIANISSEIGLMLEKATSIIDEIYIPNSEALSSVKLFLQTQLPIS